MNWLGTVLVSLAAARNQNRKALIVAVHHPPYSAAGHGGSPALLASLDAACKKAGIMPDAVLSGHAHNYQRYTRRVNLTGQAMEIPFLVAGCGGHNDLPVPLANGQVQGDHSFDKAMRGYGYLTVTVSPHRLQIDMTHVTASGATPYDTVAVDLDTHRPV